MKKSLGFLAFILVNSLVVFRAWEPGARNLLGVPFELPQIGLCFAMQATILLAIPRHLRQFSPFNNLELFGWILMGGGFLLQYFGFPFTRLG